MSGDPSHGFGHYQASAVAATVPWNWAQMLATTTASPSALQAAVAAQRSAGYNNNPHNQPQQVYSQSVPTSSTVAASPWTQQWVGSWPQPHPQQSRLPSISVQPHVASHGLPPQPAHNSFKYRLNTTVAAPTTKTSSTVPPSTASSPAHSSNTNGDKKKEENDDVWGYLEAQASFLGPSLWDNGDLKMEYMDLDEFLSENGIPIGEGGMGRSPPSTKAPTPPRSVASSDGSSGSGLVRGSSSLSRHNNNDNLDESKPGSSASTRYPDSPINYQSSPANNNSFNDDDCSNSSDSSNSSALETVAPVSLEEVTPPVGRRKRTAVSISSSVNDNTSDDGSYVPGQDFDPKSRQFSPEELRPQPMSKKSKKQYVPDDMKDDKYWARRRKNNMAAKRSRDARRVKENQIAMRAAFLEKENAVLKAELDKVTKLYTAALKRLEQYEKPGKKC